MVEQHPETQSDWASHDGRPLQLTRVDMLLHKVDREP